jgi:signal transduction histidine kinase
VRADTERIQANSEAAARIVRNLLPMIRRAPEALTFVSPNDVVREVVAARQADLAQEGIRLHAELGREVIPAPLDGPALEQVLLGLIDNAAVAIRRLGREGEVELSTRLAGRHVVLLVRDDGPGLNDAARRRLSGPLFGGGATWTGPGLGLHTAREVVAQHGGSIVGRERLGGGTEIEIRLPVLPVASESAG